MSFLTCSFKSEILGKGTTFNAILPDTRKPPFRTLYLLHGLSDDYSTWQRRTSIERYAEEKGIAVMMPDAERSFYCDMKYGYRYYTFLIEEFLPYTRKMFPLSHERDDTFIAGLSMGGYGAVKLALRNPNIFGGAASLSGCLDIESLIKNNLESHDIACIFGEIPDVSESPENVIYLAKKLAEQSEKPKIYQACGTEDFLYRDNQTFRLVMENLDYTYCYEEGSGEHTWSFWDEYIRPAIHFLFK